MTLTSMKLDPETLKERHTPSSAIDQPVYPYGLQVRLDEDAIATLGLTLPKVGSYMTLTAHVCVTSVSSHEAKSTGEPPKDNRTVELQIEAMALEPAKTDGAAAERLYSKEK